VRMPTEAEWERAAAYPPSYVDNNTRARRREYPWGNNAVTTIRGRIPASIKANIRESNIGGTSVVGIFPHGAAACGAEELAGNVWEWCSTPKVDYPFTDEVIPEDLYTTNPRMVKSFMLRGGSWDFNRGPARCADRLDYPSSSTYANSGLRIALVHVSGGDGAPPVPVQPVSLLPQAAQQSLIGGNVPKEGGSAAPIPVQPMQAAPPNPTPPPPLPARSVPRLSVSLLNSVASWLQSYWLIGLIVAVLVIFSVVVREMTWSPFELVQLSEMVSSGSATIEITTDGENLAFNKTTLEAAAGQQVTLTFKNTSAVQQHNWVLVNGGDRVASTIASDGLTAGLTANYLPANNANVLAHTKLLDGGASETITFTAPSAGTYLFICTVPGHYPLMQGTMTVK